MWKDMYNDDYENSEDIEETLYDKNDDDEEIERVEEETYSKKTEKITDSYLDNELKKIAEKDRDLMHFSYKGNEYMGRVIKQVKPNTYIFNVYDANDTSAKPCLKMFSVSNMQSL